MRTEKEVRGMIQDLKACLKKGLNTDAIKQTIRAYEWVIDDEDENESVALVENK